jgi:hypothetical protein
LLGVVHRLLDDFNVDGVSGAECAGLVVEAEWALRRLEAVKLKLVAAADRADLAKDSGLVDTGAWLARQTRAGSGEAARQARLAAALGEGLVQTGAALDAGDVSTAHAAVIADATARLPPI